MLGDAKKLIRTVKFAIDDRALARQFPHVAERYFALRAERHSPDYGIRILPSCKVVYVEVPKAACTTIKAVLQGHRGRNDRGDRVDGEALKSIRNVGPRAFFELVDDPACFVFTFVRNPYTRLISAYFSKFGKPLRSSGGFFWDAFRYFGARLFRLDWSKPLPFEWFVEMAVDTCRSGTDGHWMLMTRLVPRINLTCNFIGRIENFNRDFARVLEHLDASATEVPWLNAKPRVAAADLITDRLRARIYRAYQDDFERFQYPAALPIP